MVPSNIFDTLQTLHSAFQFVRRGILIPSPLSCGCSGWGHRMTHPYIAVSALLSIHMPHRFLVATLQIFPISASQGGNLRLQEMNNLFKFNPGVRGLQNRTPGLPPATLTCFPFITFFSLVSTPAEQELLFPSSGRSQWESHCPLLADFLINLRESTTLSQLSVHLLGCKKQSSYAWAHKDSVLLHTQHTNTYTYPGPSPAVTHLWSNLYCDSPSFRALQRGVKWQCGSQKPRAHKEKKAGGEAGLGMCWGGKADGDGDVVEGSEIRIPAPVFAALLTCTWCLCVGRWAQLFTYPHFTL